MDEAILDVVLQGRIAVHCSSIRPHNLAFSVARSPDIRRSQCGNSEAIVGEAVRANRPYLAYKSVGTSFEVPHCGKHFTSTTI